MGASAFGRTVEPNAAPAGMQVLLRRREGRERLTADCRSARAAAPIRRFERPQHVVHAEFDRFVAAEDANGHDVVFVDSDLYSLAR